MKLTCLLAAAALLATTTGAAAHASTSTLGNPGTAAATSKYLRTQALPGGGSVSYFEAGPSRDARHEQFAELRRAFETTMPTVVLIEGEDCGADLTEGATIAHRGANGYGYFLALQYGTPARALYSKAAEYEYLRTKADAEQLKLYCLLRNVYEYQQRLHAPKAVVQKAMQQFIANSYGFAPGTEHVIKNMAEFRAAYRQHCPAAPQWWKVPAAYFDADAPVASVPYPFLRDISRARADFNQQYQAGKVAAYAKAGQRVLVITAPGHAPAQ